MTEQQNTRGSGHRGHRLAHLRPNELKSSPWQRVNTPTAAKHHTANRFPATRSTVTPPMSRNLPTERNAH